ncbi:MAG: DoxX family membrane protein [Candidatus Tectimicrobiota bacterium]
MTSRSAGHGAPTSGIRAQWSRVIVLLGRLPLPLLQLLFRLALAAVFLKAGFAKLSGWEFTIQLFADEYKVPILPPDLAAMLAVSVELGCSSLLLLGLLTRLATLPMLGMIMTIQIFVYPNAYAEHLTWGSLLLFLLTRGPGVLSLDRLLGIETASPRPE